MFASMDETPGLEDACPADLLRWATRLHHPKEHASPASPELGIPRRADDNTSLAEASEFMETPPALNTFEGQRFTILISLIQAFEAGRLELGTTSALAGDVTELSS